MKPFHMIEVTHVGDDWSSDYTFIARSEEELVPYESGAYEKEELKVNGIEAVHVTVHRNLSPKEQASRFTLMELAEQYPEMNAVLTRFIRDTN